MENIDTASLIEEIKNRPPLWDKTLEEYGNRELRKQCWDDIIDVFGGNSLTATQRRYMEIELLRRWKGLRGCFTRELKRQKMCEAGYDSGPRKSEYTHFKQMMFLCKVVYSKSMPSEYFSYEVPATTLTEVKKECSDGEGFEKVGENEESDDDESDPLIEIAKRNVKRPKYDMSSEDEDKLFLLSMLKTLQRIPVEKKISIKIKLMNVLDEATKDLGD